MTVHAGDRKVASRVCAVFQLDDAGLIVSWREYWDTGAVMRQMGSPPNNSRQQCKPMLTLHHLSNSRSQKIVWLLEELELPYDLIRHQRDPATLMGPSALKAVHPLGKAPVLDDDGQLLCESGAIVEYLLSR